jgi:hypothetical protein
MERLLREMYLSVRAMPKERQLVAGSACAAMAKSPCFCGNHTRRFEALDAALTASGDVGGILACYPDEVQQDAIERARRKVGAMGIIE